MNDLNLILINHYIDGARKIGVLDEIAARNLLMQIEFQTRMNEGENSEQLIAEFAEKYYLSETQIGKIIYPRGEKKELTTNIILKQLNIKKHIRRTSYNHRRNRNI